MPACNILTAFENESNYAYIIEPKKLKVNIFNNFTQYLIKFIKIVDQEALVN